MAVDLAFLAVQLQTKGVLEGVQAMDRAGQAAKRMGAETTTAVDTAGASLQRFATTAARTQVATVEQLRAVESQLKKIGLGGEDLARAMSRFEVAQARAASASSQVAGAIAHEVNQVRALAITAKSAGDQEERLVGLRRRLQAAARDTAAALAAETAELQRQQALIAARQRLEQSRVVNARASAGFERFAAVQPTVVTTGGIVPSPASFDASAAGAKRLQNAMQVLAFSLAGVPGPVGRVAGALGSLAIGGAITVGIVAGIALIVAAYDKLTRASREARARTDELVDSLARARREQTGALVIEQEADLRRRFAELNRALASQATPRRTEFGVAGTGVTIPGEVKEQTKRDLLELADAWQQFWQQQREGARSTLETQVSALSTLIEMGRATAADLTQRSVLEAKLRAELASANITLERRAEIERVLQGLTQAGTRGVEERRKAVADLAVAEREAAAAVARLRREPGAEDTAAQQRALAQIDEQIRTATRLNATEKERLRNALLIAAAAEAYERALRRANALPLPPALRPTLRDAVDAFNPERRDPFGANLGRSTVVTLSAEQRGLVPTRAELEALLKARAAQAGVVWGEEFRRSLERNEVWRNALENFQRAFSDGFRELFRSNLGEWQAFARGITDIMTNAASEIASVFVTRTLGIDKLLKDLASGTSIGDALKNLSGGQKLGIAGVAGFGIGYGTGNAGVGALGGAATGFAVGGPVGAIVGGVSGLVGGLLGSAEKAAEAARRMREATKNFNAALDDLAAKAFPRGALEESIEALRRQFEEVYRAAVEKATAAGVTIKSDLSQTSPEKLQELARDAEAAGAEKIAQVYRDLARAREALIAAEAKARENYILEGQRLKDDLNVRALRAKGLDAEAEAEAFRLEQERERIEVGKRFSEAIDAETMATNDAVIAALLHAQALEAEQFAKAQATKAAEEAQRQADFGADLEIRRAVATGASTRAIEDMRLVLEQERELRQAVKDGISEQNLALLEQVQALEQAAAAERRRRAELEAAQDLDVRFLRALGQDRAAAELEFNVQQARERQRFQDEGFGEEFLRKLDQVQGAERTKFLEQFIEAANQDAQRAAGPNDIALTVARTISGVQADTMTSYLATIAFNTSRLVELQSGRPVGSSGFGSALSATGQAFGGTTPGPQTVHMHFGGGLTIRAAPGQTPGSALDQWLGQKLSLSREANGITPSG